MLLLFEKNTSYSRSPVKLHPLHTSSAVEIEESDDSFLLHFRKERRATEKKSSKARKKLENCQEH